jgi:hypothetical protein
MLDIIKAPFKLLGSVFFPKLFDSPEQVMDVAKGVGNWIDEQQFTPEEKSKAQFMAFEQHLKFLEATQGMNKARRYLAVLYSTTFCFTFVLCVLLTLYGFFTGDFTDVDKVIQRIADLAAAYSIGYVAIAIVGFYFYKRMDNLPGKKKE